MREENEDLKGRNRTLKEVRQSDWAVGEAKTNTRGAKDKSNNSVGSMCSVARQKKNQRIRCEQAAKTKRSDLFLENHNVFHTVIDTQKERENERDRGREREKRPKPPPKQQPQK